MNNTWLTSFPISILGKCWRRENLLVPRSRHGSEGKTPRSEQADPCSPSVLRSPGIAGTDLGSLLSGPVPGDSTCVKEENGLARQTSASTSHPALAGTEGPDLPCQGSGRNVVAGLRFKRDSDFSHSLSLECLD